MRDTLLVAGFRLAAEKGADGFSIDDVIVAAEVSRGTFYKYYTSPADLVRDVALVLSEELILTVDQLFQGHEDPAERAATAMRAVLAWVRKAPLVGAFIMRAGWPTAGPGHVFFATVGPNIDAGLASGRFQLAHREIGLALVGGLSLGAMRGLATGQMPEDFAESVAETLLVALGLARAEALRLANLPMKLPAPLAGGLMARGVV
jgi:AcrR family transcriptional regulator